MLPELAKSSATSARSCSLISPEASSSIRMARPSGVSISRLAAICETSAKSVAYLPERSSVATPDCKSDGTIVEISIPSPNT